jgi:plastocyanin
VLVAGLSTGHTIGLAVVAAVFIGFALASSFLAPRRWPDFPGRQGLSVFIIVSVVLFLAMLSAVEFFGVESEAKGAEAGAQGSQVSRTIEVTETEYRIALPVLKKLPEGTYTFVVKNAGQVGHDLVVTGPRVSGSGTPLIAPGQTAKLVVSLSEGNYVLFCAVDDHRKLGMVARLSVG